MNDADAEDSVVAVAAEEDVAGAVEDAVVAEDAAEDVAVTTRTSGSPSPSLAVS